MAEKLSVELDVNATEAQKALAKFGGTLEDVHGEGVQPLNFAIGELEDRLYEMAAAGKAGTKEFEEMAAEVGRMKKVIIDVDMQVDGLSMSFANKLGGSLQGVASGFELVQGVMGSMGAESEEVEAALLKVQSAMAMAQGLQGLKEATSSFKALGSGAINAFKGMSKAGKAFALTGIGLIITLLAEAVGVFEMFNDEAEIAEKQQKALEKALADTNKQLEDQANLTEKLTGIINEQTQAEINAAKKRGASQKELENITKEGAERRLKLLKAEQEAAEKLYIKMSKSGSTAQFEAAEKAMFEAQKKYKELRDQLRTEEADKAAEKIDTQKQTAIDNYKEVRQAIQDYHDTFLGEQEREVLEVERKFKELFKKTKKGSKDYQELQNAMLNEINEINIKYADEAIKKEEEKQKAINQAIKDAYEQRLQDEEDFFSLYQDAVNSNEQNEINAVNERYFNLIETAKQYNLDVTELEAKQKKELTEINDKYRKEEKEKNQALQDSRLNLAKDSFNTLSELATAFAGDSEAQQKRAFKINKAASIASTIIETYQAAQGAYKSQMTIPSPDAPVRASIAAAIAVAQGLARVKAIQKQEFGGGSASASSGGSSTPSLPSSSPANFTIVGNSGTNQLAETLTNAPIQAYVVGGEVTSQQQLDRNKVKVASW